MLYKSRLFILQTPTMLKNRLNIQARVAHEVIEIDKVNKTVIVKDLKTQTTYHRKLMIN